MNVGDVVNIISSVGFPIACCVYLIYNNTKQNEKNVDELEKMRTTVENNTKAMLKLCTKIGVDADD